MPAPAADRRHLLLVAGASRSGTTTLVGVMERHGFHVPKPEVATDEMHPGGFGEPRWVVDLHSRLLRRAGVQVADSRPSAWRLASEVVDAATSGRVREWLEQQFDVHDRLVVKDPRMLWFLPLWTEQGEDLGAEVGYATMLRPPPETVGSRRTYYNRDLEDPHGIASWLNLMLGTERATRRRPRGFVRYHELLDDWSPVVERLWHQVGLEPEGPPAPSADPADFVDPELRRMRLTWEDLALPERLERLASEAWDCLDALAADAAAPPDERAVRERLDALRRDYADYYAESESVAHSSVIAARRSARSRPFAPGGADPEQGPARTRRQDRVVTAVRLVPGAVRRRLPSRWRSRVRRRERARRLGGGD